MLVAIFGHRHLHLVTISYCPAQDDQSFEQSASLSSVCYFPLQKDLIWDVWIRFSPNSNQELRVVIGLAHGQLSCWSLLLVPSDFLVISDSLNPNHPETMVRALKPTDVVQSLHLSLVSTSNGPTNSILYSLRLQCIPAKAPDSKEPSHLLVASGTVFNQILVWAVRIDQIFGPHHTSDIVPTFEFPRHLELKGHEGVLFGLSWRPLDSLFLASSSDDRTVRTWQIAKSREELYETVTWLSLSSETAPSPAIKPSQTFYGHDARVWRVMWLPDHSSREDNPTHWLLVSASEDLTVRIWNSRTAAPLAIIQGHQGKHVWAIASTSLPGFSDHLLASAGADGGIRLWSLCGALDRFKFTHAPFSDAKEQNSTGTDLSAASQSIEIQNPFHFLHSLAEPTLPRSVSNRFNKKKKFEGQQDVIQLIKFIDQSHLLIAGKSGCVVEVRLLPRPLSPLCLSSSEQSEAPFSLRLVHRCDFSVKLLEISPPSSQASPLDSGVMIGDQSGFLTLFDRNQLFSPVTWKAHQRVVSLFWPHSGQLFSGGFDESGNFSIIWWCFSMVDGEKSTVREKVVIQPLLWRILKTVGSEEIVRSLAFNPLLSPTLLVVGNAIGQVFVFNCRPTDLQEGIMIDEPSPTVIHSSKQFSGFHGRERVSFVAITRDNEFVSVARNGMLCQYQVEFSQGETAAIDDRFIKACNIISQGKLCKKMNFVDDVQATLSSSSSSSSSRNSRRPMSNWAIGFYGKFLEVHRIPSLISSPSLSEQLEKITNDDDDDDYYGGGGGDSSSSAGNLGVDRLLRIECGGMNRSYDFQFFKGSTLLWAFAYVHNASLLVLRSPSCLSEENGIQNLTFSDLDGEFLAHPLHSLLINHISMRTSNPFNPSANVEIYTGGEDTFSKMSLYRCTSSPSPSVFLPSAFQFRCTQTLRGQISSVRCISFCDQLKDNFSQRLSPPHLPPPPPSAAAAAVSAFRPELMITAGGENCVLIWKRKKDKWMLRHQQRDRFREDNCCRVMSCAAIGPFSAEHISEGVHPYLLGKHLLMIGLSDSEVHLYAYYDEWDTKPRSVSIGWFKFHNGPILNLQLMTALSARWLFLVVTSSTDGQLAFFDLTLAIDHGCDSVSREKVSACSGDSNVFRDKEKASQKSAERTVAAPPGGKKKLTNLKEYFTLRETQRFPTQMTQPLATFAVHQSGVNGLSFEVSKKTDENGGRVVDFATSGDDQSVKRWRFSFRFDGNSVSIELLSFLERLDAHVAAVSSLVLKEGLIFSSGPDQIMNVWDSESLERLASHILDIPDVSCVDVLFLNDMQQEKKEFLIAAVGFGLQLLRLRILQK